MRLKTLELNGFKSFSQKTTMEFLSPVVAIVGPNGSGKSNVVEAFRFVLGEQSMKSMRGKSGLDLIFKGSKALPKGTRAGVVIHFDNIDKVFKLSNESGENINLSYDAISISREVYSDGLNKYILNGQEVRLKDIHNLLASVNIGSSGHHIISQGEADRILNASAKDRREMVEDALGLKIYQYKIKESARKLEKTEENMKEVTMLRRENAPHLNFLKKQVEKFEKSKEMQAELLGLYLEYLKKESVYLDREKSSLTQEKNKIKKELDEVSSKISETEDGASNKGSKKVEELRQVEKKINEIRSVKSEIERKLGRIEGMIEMEERRKEQAPEIFAVPPEEIKLIVEEINASLNEASQKQNIDEIRPILSSIKNILKRLSKESKKEGGNGHVTEIDNLKKARREMESEMGRIALEEKKITGSIETLKHEINEEMSALRDKEREKFSWKVRQQELSSGLEIILVKESNLHRETEAFENELKEGSVIVGPEILSYKKFQFESMPDRGVQEETRRKIERIKIKLEDAGLGSANEIVKEFEEVSARDKFLESEMGDLAASVESLKKLMTELKNKIDIEFKEGIKKINVEFQEFFSLMFGGGSGHLSVVVENKKKRTLRGIEDEELDNIEEEIVFEEGIEINVSLPHKKVKELHALSGGERSLTSIALLFAMSQVNPPPFLVLDETDAALDEANSRKYGDMLEKLSKHSQLVVVTHNRETMSRAGVLYGVTIGQNGASKLLSVRFDEAAQIAK